MSLDELIKLIKHQPERIAFADVMAVIDRYYIYTETAFSNGPGDDAILNAAGANAGSCRIFAFGKLQGLSERQTLACFGQYYRDVLAAPNGDDHANIRAFMRHGWQGIEFSGTALVAR